MYDALQHPMFASLRLDAHQTAATLHAAAHPQQQGQGLQHVQSLHGSYDSSATSSSHLNGSSTVRYLHYYRGAAPVCTPTSGRSHALSFNMAHAAPQHHLCDALPIL